VRVCVRAVTSSFSVRVRFVPSLVDDVIGRCCHRHILPPPRRHLLNEVVIYEAPSYSVYVNQTAAEEEVRRLNVSIDIGRRRRLPV